jgi:hypothetical protein
MALSAKQWTGIAVAVIGILVLSISGMLESQAINRSIDTQYFEIRKTISRQLSILPRQYAAGHGDVCQNTLLEIK